MDKHLQKHAGLDRFARAAIASCEIEYGQTLAAKDQWYVVHCAFRSGKQSARNIVKRVKTEEMGDSRLRCARSDRARFEIKKGKKTETTRKFFPGYLIVNMHLLDENNQLVGRTWYFDAQYTRCDRVCRHQGQTDPDATIGSGKHARADERARGKGETESQLRSWRNVKVADGPFQNQTVS
jgi:transcriptional antiterminator NusG